MSQRRKKFNLVFASNFKQENSYLQEWIEYHLIVGVDHFYLYDQDGSEEARELLAPYEKEQLVTRHQWTHLDGSRFDGPTRFYQVNKNHLAFTHCARTYREYAQWMMKIDIDEFLYPPAGEDHLSTYLDTVDDGRVKGIHIPRFNYGYNNHETQPSGLVIESYTKREPDASDHKDMANCGFLSNNRFCYSAHWWHYKFYKPGIYLRESDVNGIRINHYYTKSFEEYMQRQNVSRGRKRDRNTFNEKNRLSNDVEDQGMLRFTDAVRCGMKDRSKAGA